MPWNEVSAVDLRREFVTLARVFRHISTVVISLVVRMLALSELDILMAPILGVAGGGRRALFWCTEPDTKIISTVFSCCWRTISAEAIWSRFAKKQVWSRHHSAFTCLCDNESSMHYMSNGQIATASKIMPTY